MKLKNSYILLIVMSLFLLISIGSVCASDAAMDADIPLSDDTDGGDAVTTTPIPTSVESENVRVNENDPQEIPVAVKDNETQTIDIVKGNLTVTENNKNITFTYNNSIIKITDKLSVGNHSLIVSYLGNSIYAKSSTNITLSVVGNNYTIQSPTSVNVNSTKIIEIPLNITNGVDILNIDLHNFNVTLEYKEGNNTTKVLLTVLDYKNGKLSLNYPLANNITSSTLALVYTDEENKLSKNITLNRIYNAKIEIINSVNEYLNGNFTFKFTDADDGTIFSDKEVTLTTIGNIRAGFSGKTNSEGIANFKNANLYEFDQNSSSLNMEKFKVGSHHVELSLKNPIKGTFNADLTVTKASIKIVIEPFSEDYGTDKNVTITVTNANNGEPVPGTVLHLSMPETTGKDYYFATDTNGQSKISVKQLIPGTYNVTVSNNDTENINKKSVDGKITIKPVATKATVTIPSTYYYNTGNIATIKITDKATGKAVPNAIVLVQIFTGKASQAYLYQANDKGIITVSYAPTTVGYHRIVISSADTRYSFSTVTKGVTVKKATAKFTASKMTTYYKSGKVFTIKLTNTKNNKPIYGANVNIKVFVSKTSYYNYNAQTGLDGTISLSLGSFKPGTYKVVVSSTDTKNYTAKEITSQFVIKTAPAKLTPTPVTAKKGENKYFEVTVKNTKTNKVISGVKVTIKVYTGKSYKTYTATTNSKGIAKIGVKSLSVGTHKVVVSSGNKYVTAKSATSSIKITK